MIELTKEIMEKNPDSGMHAYVSELGGEVSGRTAFDCARKGDRAANEVVDTFVYYLGSGIVDLINLFQPAVIIEMCIRDRV